MFGTYALLSIKWLQLLKKHTMPPVSSWLLHHLPPRELPFDVVSDGEVIWFSVCRGCLSAQGYMLSTALALL